MQPIRCQDRYKGHGLDDEGRPLGRRMCVPLPDTCRSTPSCACVMQHVSATHCSNAGGQISIDDYPR